jgi:CubicO group peptidase (beta-lactamase class C family)
MKRSRLGRLVLPVLALALTQNSLASSSLDHSLERRVERVLNGLLPNTHLKHQFAPKASLQERMAHFHTPGVSIAVVNNYQVEWARGFGVKEWGKSAPVTERTLFQAGSISKPMFALAVMRLAQDGQLDLDGDANDYLKSWKVPANGSWQPQVTLRQLLTHSAGLTVHGFPGYLRSEKLPTLVQILDGIAPAHTGPVRVNFLPGSHVRYSGGGTTVAQLLVTDLLQKPFPQIMREVLFLPLGMGHSTYEQPLPRALHKQAATAHPWRYRPVDGKWHVYPEMAAAGLWTTPSDLARAGIELQLALKGETNRFLSPQQAERMLTGRDTENVGLGFMLSAEGKVQRFSHGGWDEGFVAQMTMYRDHGIGAVIMVNSNEGDPLLLEIERAIAREYNWPGYFRPEKRPIELDSSLAEACVGEYVGPRSFECAITRDADKLFFKAKGQNPIQLHADADTNLFTTVLNLELNFSREPNGEIKSITCNQNGVKIELERKKSSIALTTDN